MIYFDSSYLARCYLEDPGYREVRELAAADKVACATLGQAEVVAAFHRKLREGALTPAAFAATVRQFETDHLNGVVTWLPITAVILQQVRRAFANLPATVFLRSADALHLVCARESGLLEIHSNDRHLLAAALDHLLGDAALRERLSRNGRRLVAERFTLAAMGAALRKLYEEVLSSRLAGTP